MITARDIIKKDKIIKVFDYICNNIIYYVIYK